MPDILHRISIDAPADRVHELIASPDGIARWWTGHAVDGETGVGNRFAVRFGAADRPAAVMQVVVDTPDEVTWRVVEGPGEWIDTVVRFTLRPGLDGGMTLLFSHADWHEASEFMSGCSTNWGAYLTSLKTGTERGEFAPYPAGEISRWG